VQPNRSRLVTVVLKTLLPSGQPRYTELKLDMLVVEAAGHDATSSRRDWLEAATEKIIELLDTGIKRLDPGASIHASEKRESIKAIAHNIHNYAAYDGIVLALNGRFNPPAAPTDPGPARELADSRRELEWYKLEYPKLKGANDRLQQRVNEMEPEFKEHRVYCSTRPTTDELEKWKSEATAYKQANQELRNVNQVLNLTIPNLEERERLARESEHRSAQALVDAQNRIADLIQRVNMLAAPGTKPIDPGADTTPPQPEILVSGTPVSGIPVQGSTPQSVKEPSPSSTPPDRPTIEESQRKIIADLQWELADFKKRLIEQRDERDMVDRRIQELIHDGVRVRGGGTVKTIDEDDEEAPNGQKR
jgi:DNA repair exonuclease SbcCD ATPase subunit